MPANSLNFGFCAEIPDLQVLSTKEEAELSFLAGVMGTPEGSRRDVDSLSLPTCNRDGTVQEIFSGEITGHYWQRKREENPIVELART
jgi:hypothetical protein